MTASDATATIKKGNSEPSFDKTAQRILNLFFVLNSSPEPLTTEQIVLDSDLGYGSGNIDSDKRKFRRDRNKLLERGILIKEVRPAGAQETEESSWTIDREHTFAAGGLITADDADILLNAIDHGQATEVAIAIRRSAGNIEISVRDNGLGVSPKHTSGFGTTLIDTWCRTLGGSWNLQPVPGRGTILAASLPSTRR